jgi:metal-dependent HD superfamily phosphatase/phosphodiesterase
MGDTTDSREAGACTVHRLQHVFHGIWLREDILDGHLLSAIVGSVTEVDLEHSELSSVYDLDASARGSRSSAGKKSRRYGKNTKSKIVSR